MTNRNKAYNPFEHGVELHDINWTDVRLQVVGEKDNFVLYGRTKSGGVYVLNIVGNEVFGDGE